MSLLTTSTGYNWVYILNSIHNIISFDDATDDDFQAYCDVYDRPRNDSNLSVLNAMFLFIKLFAGSSFPNIDAIQTGIISPDIDIKLRNLGFVFDLGQELDAPLSSSKLWKFIYFMWQVNRGVVIHDAAFFSLLKKLKAVKNLKQRAVSDEILPFNTSRPIVNKTVRCILANTAFNNLFTSISNVASSYNAASVDVSLLDHNNVSGVYLIRRAFINADQINYKTKLFLRIIIDPFNARTPVVENSSTSSTPPILLEPYKIITQAFLHFGKNGVTLANLENITIETDTILDSRKTSNLESLPGSFFHLDYAPSKDKILDFQIVDIVKASIKHHVMIVDLQVSQLSLSSNPMITPTLLSNSQLTSAVSFTMPVSDYEYVDHPPLVSQQSFTFSASSILNNSSREYGPALLFDRNDITFWSSLNLYTNGLPNQNGATTLTVTGDQLRGEWIQIQLPNPIIFKGLTIKRHTSIVNFALCASVNGTSWNLILRGTLNNNNATVFDFESNSIAFSFYRLVITSCDSNTSNAAIQELLFKEIIGPDVRFVRDDFVMACNDPNLALSLSLNNRTRT